MLFFLYGAAWLVLPPLATAFLRRDGRIGRGLRGRRGAARRLAEWAARERDPRRALVWVHAPSVGEGRQAEAVIERLRTQRPGWQIAYTFTSPSAEAFARRLAVDVADYLPPDTPAETARALGALRPDAIWFSAADLWPELVRQAELRRVPLGLLSGTVAPTSSRLWPLVRGFLRPTYAALDSVGAISSEDAERLLRLGVRPARVVVTGDTRHDAAAARAARVCFGAPYLAALADARRGRPLLVAGSTWPADERVLVAALAELRRAGTSLRVLIAPHEPSVPHLLALGRRLAAALGPSRRVEYLSALEAKPARPAAPPPAAWDVCLVDRVGILADLYALASVAYVGGGFHRAGLHAVIEPAVLGVPVLFGPRWQGSRDARLLLEAGGGRAVRDWHELSSAVLYWLHEETARAAAGAAARAVVEHGQGAGERSLQLVTHLVERAGG